MFTLQLSLLLLTIPCSLFLSLFQSWGLRYCVPYRGCEEWCRTRGGSHPVTSLQNSKAYFGLFQGWAALRLWIWSTGVLHAGTQSCCPCLSHSALPTHPVYVYPSPRSTLSTMNATGSYLHLKSWPSPALIPRRGFSTQGILASVMFASAASAILGILPWNCCIPFLHPQWIPSKGQRAEVGEWLCFSKWGFPYQHSDFYFHWGRVQNRGAEVFQGEPALDNLCF